MEALPTFIVIGAMKAGTTSLAAYLGAHPDVFVTNPKEARFFGSGDDRNWKRGVAWYQQLFANANAAKARGEASPGYTMAPHVSHVPERIAAVVPDVKLIYLLRNPVERIRSAYLDRAARGVEVLPLREALAEKPRYLDASRYAYQLDRYLEHFAREQILVLSSERLREERRDVLHEVLEFIGVDPDVELANTDRELNRGSEKRVPVGLYQTLSTPFRRTGATRVIPPRFKRRVRRAFSRPPPLDHLETRSDLAEIIWSELEPDLSRLREHVGPAFDLWGRV